MKNIRFPICIARVRALCALLLAAAPLSGCNVGPKYVRPNYQAPPAYKESAPEQASDGSLWKQVAPANAPLSEKWWEIYENPELNDPEDKLNTSNQNIAQAFQNFMAARAQVRQARSNFSPTVNDHAVLHTLAVLAKRRRRLRHWRHKWIGWSGRIDDLKHCGQSQHERVHASV